MNFGKMSCWGHCFEQFSETTLDNLMYHFHYHCHFVNIGHYQEIT
jgi:hypothetical protein